MLKSNSNNAMLYAACTVSDAIRMYDENITIKLFKKVSDSTYVFILYCLALYERN